MTDISSTTPDIMFDSPSTELSSNRTAMSFERTRMSADRTLMSIIRTALSLIGFGFTIFKFFNEVGKQLGREVITSMPARNFGMTLVLMGVGLLIAGLLVHRSTIGQLDERRDHLHGSGLLRHGRQHSTSPTAVVAILLLLSGLLVVLGMAVRAGPFG